VSSRPTAPAGQSEAKGLLQERPGQKQAHGLDCMQAAAIRFDWLAN